MRAAWCAYEWEIFFLHFCLLFLFRLRTRRSEKKKNFLFISNGKKVFNRRLLLASRKLHRNDWMDADKERYFERRCSTSESLLTSYVVWRMGHRELRKAMRYQLKSLFPSIIGQAVRQTLLESAWERFQQHVRLSTWSHQPARLAIAFLKQTSLPMMLQVLCHANQNRLRKPIDAAFISRNKITSPRAISFEFRISSSLNDGTLIV